MDKIDLTNCLTELAEAKKILLEKLTEMSFNSNGGDTNGNVSKWKLMEKESREIDKLIELVILKDKKNE